MTWKQEAASTAQTVLQNPKVAWGVTGTTGILAVIADWVNSIFVGMGTNSLSIAATLSAVLICNNVLGGINKRKIERSEFEKSEIEKEILRKRLESMQSGTHNRRSTDRDNSNAVDG